MIKADATTSPPTLRSNSTAAAAVPPVPEIQDLKDYAQAKNEEIEDLKEKLRAAFRSVIVWITLDRWGAAFRTCT
mgnify:CR=1 FL=1